MEIKATRPVERPHAPAAAAPPPRPEERIQPADITSSAVLRARAHAPELRAARLEELKHAVKAGHYRPDPARIASEILRQAELDAQLSTLLRP